MKKVDQCDLERRRTTISQHGARPNLWMKIPDAQKRISVILSGSEEPVLEGNCSAALKVHDNSNCRLQISLVESMPNAQRSKCVNVARIRQEQNSCPASKAEGPMVAVFRAYNHRAGRQGYP